MTGSQQLSHLISRFTRSILAVAAVTVIFVAKAATTTASPVEVITEIVLSEAATDLR